MSTADAERRASRRGGRGLRVRFTVVPSKLGRLLVAATDRGICAVQLGDSEQELEARFRTQFFAAELRRDDAGLRAWARQLRAAAEGGAEAVSLPLDQVGTAFQRRVWEALSRIPRGEVRTYSELAAEVGSPKATRAVASACAANPVAIAVPCHRVVRRDGGLGGYRWGLARKRRLLGAERNQLAW